MNLKKIVLLLTLVFSKLLVMAQLCQGSLGDPIVNITFGAGGNPGPALSAATTNYSYVSTDCPNDGQYTVRNGTGACFSGSWHSLPTDHTRDPGGYFMLVNASFQPSAFYVDTVDLFCSNTTYEFAAWIINMMRNTTCGGGPTILSNLTFSIEKPDGTVLQTYNTGDLPVYSNMHWEQYGFFFTAPSGVTRVVLRITNNAPGGCGNDLGIDDITFRPCGPLVEAHINDTASTVELCQGIESSVLLSSSVSIDFNNPYLQWQRSNNNGTTWTDIPGANSATLMQVFGTATPPGIYMYRLAVSKQENVGVPLCRINSRKLTITVNPTPVFHIITNSPVCQNSTLTLEANGTGGVFYSWQGPNGFVTSGVTVSVPDIQLNQAGKYYAQTTNAALCTNIDSVVIAVKPGPTALASPAEISICEGQSVALSSSGGDRYEWKPATALSSISIPNPVAAPKDSTHYVVTVSNSFSCSDTASVQVNVFKRPQASAGPDREILRGQTVQLSGMAKGSAITYAWSAPYAIDDIHKLNPTVNPLVDTSYVLTVKSGAGCGNAADTVRVKVYKEIYVPTAFTPNNDGLNDQFRIIGASGFKEIELSVYNRYGQVISYSKHAEPWDGKFKGKEQPTGVYVYTIRIAEANIFLKGLVTLIR
jgi:gliding motility-associated-like protein